MNPIQNLISLGNNCRTRFQIGKYLEKFDNKNSSVNYFFDSLMMGGLQGVISHIERGFIIKKNDIYSAEVNGKFLPRDKYLKMAFLHDFGCKHTLWDNESDCTRGIEENHEESLRKYNYLGEKTNSLLTHSNQNTALIFHGNEKKEIFQRLIDLLKEKYCSDFLIVNIVEKNECDLAEKNERIITIQVNDNDSPKNGTPNEWEGWNESWSNAFDQIPIRLIQDN